LSDVAELSSGVVQGSGIGPLMFLTYINELIGILDKYNMKANMFADDLKMYDKVLNVLIYGSLCFDEIQYAYVGEHVK